MPLYRAELLAKKPLRYAALIHNVSQVLYLPFDWDDGSYARDRSGYNNHGTIYGATLTAGKIGSARSFDGTDDKVEVPHSTSLNISGAFTIAAWIYPKAKPQNGGIFEKTIGGYVNKQFLLFLEGNNIRMRVVKGGTGYTLTSASTFTLNTWQFLAAVYDGSKGYIYIDGNLDKSGTLVSAPLDSGTGISLIGHLGSNVYPFNGIIDEPRICDRDLSAGEIRMLMYRRLM